MTMRDAIAAWGGLVLGMAIMLGAVIVGRFMDRREAERLRRRLLRPAPDDNQLAAYGDVPSLPHSPERPWPGLKVR